MSSPVVAIADYRSVPVFRTAVETIYVSKELRPNSCRASRLALTTLGDGLDWDIPVSYITVEVVVPSLLLEAQLVRQRPDAVIEVTARLERLLRSCNRS